MKLLGFTIDRHFTGAEHTEATKRKCQSLLGVLKRAPIFRERFWDWPTLSFFRGHLEYVNAVQAPYSQTQLEKLDTIQRIAAHIIMVLPRDAYAAPLIEILCFMLR